MLTETGRVTLSDRTLSETVGPERRERTGLNDAEVLDAYKTHFGIELDRMPARRAGPNPVEVPLQQPSMSEQEG
jgi:N-hydroxyarylamine O-acetyltransferase